MADFFFLCKQFTFALIQDDFVVPDGYLSADEGDRSDEEILQTEGQGFCFTIPEFKLSFQIHIFQLLFLILSLRFKIVTLFFCEHKACFGS